MKKNLLVLFIIGVVLFSCTTNGTESGQESFPDTSAEKVSVQPPFSKGVNLTGWFESFSAQSIPFTKYNEQDFANVKSLGADVVRLPIRMHSMTSGAPDYTLDPLLLNFLDTAIGWAEKYELYIIIDNHSFDPVANTANDVDKILLPVWAQIAQRYKDKSKYVIYEVLNEPHGIGDARWGEVQGMAIETIRKFDTTHSIIVGGTDFNSIGKLSALPRYTDTNLIYTFHFYDPHLFTHQGANWGEPQLTSLSGLPFPADSKRMPSFPSVLRGTWIEGAFYNYANDATAKKLYSTLDRPAAFSRERGAPVFCGEFGVYMFNAPQEDRVRWYEIVSAALDRRGISRTNWDYYGGFGLFNSPNRGDFNSDLNVEVVRALGFTPPPQTPRPQVPVTSGFVFYDDYSAADFAAASWGENADFSLYDTNTADGEFAIRWGNAAQYNNFTFDFNRGGDLTYLVSNGYFLEFSARTESAVNFDLRFLNPENTSSIPWRMRYTINENILPPDGQWHTIRIKLADMNEHGAWLNSTQEWLSPKGEFSWANVVRLEFTAEYEGGLSGKTVWFDDIKIVN